MSPNYFHCSFHKPSSEDDHVINRNLYSSSSPRSSSSASPCDRRCPLLSNHRSHSFSLRSKNCYHWILFITFILSSLSLTSSSFHDKDEINETICKPVPEESISISCPEDMKLVFKESYFSTSLDANPHCVDNNNHVRRTTTPNDRDCYEDLRPSIIAKCMTAKNCTFNSKEMMAQCSGSGHILLKYSCIKPYLLAHYCNSVLDRPHGYISSPTYPDYAAAVEDCNWTITANDGQNIELQVLDLQITQPVVIKPKTFLDSAVLECTDALILDADEKTDSLCGDDIENLKTFHTKGSMVKISYKQNLFRATRGFLLRYQVNGCPKLKDPFKGHIVEQNESSAVISCCEGYIFKDTRESKKYLNCLRNNWDGIVSSCLKIGDIDAPDTLPELDSNSIDGDANINDSTNLPSSGQQLSKPIDGTEKALFSDFVIPISLMVLLVVVLVIFVVTIVKCRSRRSKANLLTFTHEATVPLTNKSPVNV